MRKSDLAKVGDKVKFQVNSPTRKDISYQMGKVYDGVILKHQIDVDTQINIIDDNGDTTCVRISYDCFSNGMSSFDLDIPDEEFEARKQEWVSKTCDNIRKEMAQKLEERINYIENVKFH